MLAVFVNLFICGLKKIKNRKFWYSYIRGIFGKSQKKTCFFLSKKKIKNAFGGPFFYFDVQNKDSAGPFGFRSYMKEIQKVPHPYVRHFWSFCAHIFWEKITKIRFFEKFLARDWKFWPFLMIFLEILASQPKAYRRFFVYFLIFFRK